MLAHRLPAFIDILYVFIALPPPSTTSLRRGYVSTLVEQHITRVLPVKYVRINKNWSGDWLVTFFYFCS